MAVNICTTTFTTYTTFDNDKTQSSFFAQLSSAPNFPFLSPNSSSAFEHFSSLDICEMQFSAAVKSRQRDEDKEEGGGWKQKRATSSSGVLHRVPHGTRGRKGGRWHTNRSVTQREQSHRSQIPQTPSSLSLFFGSNFASVLLRNFSPVRKCSFSSVFLGRVV